jgi:ATP-dependent Lon protease
MANEVQDGPSAGMAHTIALISLFSGKAVPPTMAMTVRLSENLCCLGILTQTGRNIPSWPCDCRRRNQREAHWSLKSRSQDCAPTSSEQERVRDTQYPNPCFLMSKSNSRYSVKDLPQEVKDGLEIIHVR